MIEIEISGHPQPAQRPTFSPKFHRMLTPRKYREYKQWLIEQFEPYTADPAFQRVITHQKYGIGVIIEYRIYGRGSKKPFNQMRPDIDNLYKATVDALFQTEYVQQAHVDDSNVVYTQILKRVVATHEAEGQKIKLIEIGVDDVEL